jgi:hypothetical protein
VANKSEFATLVRAKKLGNSIEKQVVSSVGGAGDCLELEVPIVPLS